MLETTVAILPNRDFDETVAFCAKFGFNKTGRWEDHQYLIICREKVELHFFGHKDHTPETGNHGVYIRSSDVDALSAELAAVTFRPKAFRDTEPSRTKIGVCARPWLLILTATYCVLANLWTTIKAVLYTCHKTFTCRAGVHR